MPKTGGTFVRRVLVNCAPPEWEVVEVIALGGAPRNDPNHPTVRDIPSFYKGLPVFGFVRNPWDWYVSWYEFLKIDGTNALFNEASDNGRRGFCETVLRLFASDLARKIDVGIFTWYFRESYGKEPYRIRFLKFENLRQELIRALSDVAEASAAIKETIKSTPPLNVSVRKPYKAYYTEEVKELIAAKDRDLISRFGYVY